ncbi:MAG: pyridoxal kinase PdxY [Rhodospirillales bacterium]|nr:pyridoxal kinase PdxY [Rhodospirillales bacterium]
MAILSIQSHVAYGHVGNAAAAFPLQRLGFEVWRVNTVQFSNHTGYDDWQGQVFEPAHIAQLIDGIAARGVLGECQAVLSGYLGDAALGAVILDAVERVRRANPAALYACDPVMGDREQGLFVRPGIPEFLRDRALPAADIITPNQFELETLTGRAVRRLADAVEAARLALALGPGVVLVTSLRHADTAPDEIEMLAVTAQGAWRVATPFLALDPAPNGAGDALAALFLAHYLKAGSQLNRTPEALERAAAAIYAVVEATGRAGTRELQIIAAQDAFAQPAKSFAVEDVS